MSRKNTPAAEAEAPAGLIVESNNAFVVEDNTAAEAVAEVPVEESEVELLDGFVQVNYL
jgi:hypothetical protein